MSAFFRFSPPLSLSLSLALSFFLSLVMQMVEVFGTCATRVRVPVAELCPNRTLPGQARASIMTPVGFEPARPALLELEHSGRCVSKADKANQLQVAVDTHGPCAGASRPAVGCCLFHGILASDAHMASLGQRRIPCTSSLVAGGSFFKPMGADISE